MDLADIVNQNQFDALKESLKPLYKEAEPGKYALDIDLDNVLLRTGYKDNLNNLKKQSEELRNELNSWRVLGEKDKITSEINNLKKLNTDYTQKIEQLSKANGGDFDKQINEIRMAAAKESTEQIAAANEKWKKLLEDEAVKVADLNKKIEENNLNSQLRELAKGIREEKNMRLFLNEFRKRFVVNPVTGKLSLLDEDGSVAIKSPEAFMEDFVMKEYPYWFEGNRATGSGAANNFGVGASRNQGDMLAERLASARSAADYVALKLTQLQQ